MLTFGALTLLIYSGPSRGERAGALGSEFLVTLSSSDAFEYHQALDFVTDQGADVTLGFLPSSFIATLPTAAVGPVTRHPAVALVTDEAIDPVGLIKYGPAARHAADV
jgi:hypothetical protein